VTPAEAARIKYSTQRFVYLNVGESYTFHPKDGWPRRFLLKSVTEQRDTVIGLPRRADVAVEIAGKQFNLVCEPYRMPVEHAGLRIQADTTSRWINLPRRVQFSVWDASDPILDVRLFVFPLPRYRLFSQGTQGHNEPVHLGHRDGDPNGQRFCHDYGFDLAGFEGKEPVVSCIDGIVLEAHPATGTLAIEDDRGIVLHLGHLDSIEPGLRPGTQVARGQTVGILGRKGASGNFSHLHVGLFLSKEKYRAGRPCRALNLYPWLVEAYRHAAPFQLAAVARPHLAVRTGQLVRFDGTRSLAFGSSVTSYRWEFPGRNSFPGPQVERVFDLPGTYPAALWVEDERGLRDVDFATVRVYSKEKPESIMPTLFVTYTPSREIRVGQPVSFRIWPQGIDVGHIRLDLGEGRVIEGYKPYTTLVHRFKAPGIHVVTVSGSAGSLPVTQKVKVVVQ
jgi:murein DD-endopeptidase MepM/ murein hydrolase activator NlpD